MCEWDGERKRMRLVVSEREREREREYIIGGRECELVLFVKERYVGRC